MIFAPHGLDTSETISTGGDSNWGGTRNTYYYDGDATYSRSIYDDEETWMQTTVTASSGDEVSFFWKVSSESSCDYLKFYIDGSLKASISGEVDWEKKSYSLSAGSRTLKWVYSKDSSDDSGDDRGWVDGLVIGHEKLVPQPGTLAEATDCDLPLTTSGYMTWEKTSGQDKEYYLDGDSAKSGPTSNGEESVLQTLVDSDSTETITFWWKVSCQSNYDYLKFYIDGTFKAQITGNVDWQEKSYSVSSGPHTLKWVYEDGGGYSDEKGWVDFIQWTGDSPAQDTSNWQQIDYKYDVYGRRIEKIIDGYGTRYLHDGAQVIAEYDGNNNLLRKFIYGPGIDQPVSMAEVAFIAFDFDKNPDIMISNLERFRKCARYEPFRVPL